MRWVKKKLRILQPQPTMRCNVVMFCFFVLCASVFLPLLFSCSLNEQPQVIVRLDRSPPGIQCQIRSVSILPRLGAFQQRRQAVCVQFVFSRSGPPVRTCLHLIGVHQKKEKKNTFPGNKTLTGFQVFHVFQSKPTEVEERSGFT